MHQEQHEDSTMSSTSFMRGVRSLSCEVFREERECFSWAPSTLFLKRTVAEYDDDSPDTDGDYITFFKDVDVMTPFTDGFVRIVEYVCSRNGVLTGRVIAMCRIELRCIRRHSERVRRDAVHGHTDTRRIGWIGRTCSSPISHSTTTIPVFDLTTLDDWTERVCSSPDYVALPPLVTLKFEDRLKDSTAREHRKEGRLTCAFVFRKVVPRRYIDCCFETGKLSCYALEAARIVRSCSK
jgi:hypothetical protein